MFFNEKIERIDDRHLGCEIDRERELSSRFGKVVNELQNFRRDPATSSGNAHPVLLSKNTT